MKYSISFIVILFSLHTYAAPSITGPTGLLEIPTADVLRYQEYGLGVDFLSESRSVKTPDDESSYFYKFNIGTYDNVEMGVVGGTKPDEGVFINMKYNVFTEEKVNPLGVAIGVEKLTSDHETASYIITSKSFNGGLSTHFGFRALFDQDIDASALLGTDYFVTDSLSLLIDMIGKKSVYRLNIGARWFVSSGVTIQASVLDMAGLSNNPQFTIGASITQFL